MRVLLFCCFCVCQFVFALPNFPELSSRVVDSANILSPKSKEQIAIQLKSLEQKSTIQLVVVTLPSLDGYDIAEYGYQLGRHWKIGTKQNNGLLLIIAPRERKARIEVGYGLEGIITDVVSFAILQEAFVPYAKNGNFDDAIIQVITRISTLLLPNQATINENHQSKKEVIKPQDRLDLGSYFVYFWIFFLFPIVTILLGYLSRQMFVKRKQIIKATTIGIIVWWILAFVGVGLILCFLVGFVFYLLNLFSQDNSNSLIDFIGTDYSSHSSGSFDGFDVFGGGGGSFGGGGGSIDF